jgi:hypothetical protein
MELIPTEEIPWKTAEVNASVGDVQSKSVREGDSSPRRSVASWLRDFFEVPMPPPRRYFSKYAYSRPRVARARANAVLDRREP